MPGRWGSTRFRAKSLRGCRASTTSSARIAPRSLSTLAAQRRSRRAGVEAPQLIRTLPHTVAGIPGHWLRFVRRVGPVRMPSSNIELNHVLAVLPQEVLERWRPALQLVELRLGDVLHEPGGVQSHVYFPTTAIVSLLYILDTGASAEIAIVGNEGLVGVSLFMGGGSTIGRAVVQSAGKGYRLPAAMLLEDFKREPVLHLLLRYTQALITQTCQTAVCNRHHSLDQQLCRWLLLSLDRLQCDALVMTQELIAQ